MVETNLVIYALSGVVVILSLILTTRFVKRRNNKPENIWENTTRMHLPQRIQAAPPPPPPPPPPPGYSANQPMRPPAPHLFSHR